MDYGDVAFEADPFGPLRIWHPPSPGSDYVIGVDVAEGITPDGARKGGDFSAAWVIDARTLEHCATWHGHLDPYPFSEEVNSLGHYYNRALLAVEKNNHGHTVIKRLVNDLKYPAMYHQVSNSKARGNPKGEVGFMTTGTKHGGGSKALVVDALRAVVRRVTPIYDHRFYTEGLTWILDERGRPKTNDGANDDVLMASAIAYYVAQEIYGTNFITRRPVNLAADSVRRKERKETWRKILASTQDTGRGEPVDPWSGVPEEIKQHYT